jgi:hypothetical protein
MSLDLNIPVVIGGASALIGYGLAYLLYKKFISNKYGKGKENANSAYYWCGLIAMIAFGQGLGTLINEGLLFLTSNSSINGDAVGRGLVILIFYPALLAIIAALINKFSSKKDGNNVITQSDLSVQSSLNLTTNSNGFSKTHVFITLVICLFGVGVYIFYNGNFSSNKEKKFDALNCEHCRWLVSTQKFECNPLPNFRYFVVGPEKIQIFGVKEDNSIAIQELPDADTKCIINSTAKYSFACSSSSFDRQNTQKFESSKEFDGSNIYKSNFKAYFIINGENKLWNHDKTTCTMKG